MGNIDDIFNDSDTTGSGEVQNTQGTSEVEPVKLGRLATTGILIVGIIIVIILLLTVRGCTIEKKANQDNNGSNTSSISTENTYNNQKNSGNNQGNYDNNYTNQQQVVSTPNSVGEIKEFPAVINQEDGTSSESMVSSVDSPLIEGSEPILCDLYETQGMVVNKSTYTFDNSYVYQVCLALLIGDEVYNAYYFCPNKTYDALSSMDYVKVEFQLDGDENFSIYSISKN